MARGPGLLRKGYDVPAGNVDDRRGRPVLDPPGRRGAGPDGRRLSAMRRRTEVRSTLRCSEAHGRHTRGAFAVALAIGGPSIRLWGEWVRFSDGARTNTSRRPGNSRDAARRCSVCTGGTVRTKRVIPCGVPGSGPRSGAMVEILYVEGEDMVRGLYAARLRQAGFVSARRGQVEDEPGTGGQRRTPRAPRTDRPRRRA